MTKSANRTAHKLDWVEKALDSTQPSTSGHFYIRKLSFSLNFLPGPGHEKLVISPKYLLPVQKHGKLSWCVESPGSPCYRSEWFFSCLQKTRSGYGGCSQVFVYCFPGWRTSLRKGHCFECELHTDDNCKRLPSAFSFQVLWLNTIHFQILDKDEDKNWYKAEQGDREGWIPNTYITMRSHK